MESKRKAEVIFMKESFNQSFSFYNFVVHDGNRLAYAVSSEIIKSPGRYNPIYIYGKNGSGKTNLLLTIKNKLKEIHPELNSVYITGDEMLDTQIDNIHKCRGADVLLVDDIQSIAKSESAQDEIWSIYVDFIENKKQLVLVADKEPRKIVGLQPRLCAHFQHGLVVDIFEKQEKEPI